MSKSKEELNAIKEEVEAVNRKRHKLTDEELALVSGGSGVTGKNGCTGGRPCYSKCGGCSYFFQAACTLSGEQWGC